MKAVSHLSRQRNRRRIIIALSIIVALLIIFDLSPFGGNARFYATWIGCGQKPAAEDISIGFGAQVSHYIEPKAVEPVRFGQPDYFCTPLEAEKAGYSSNPNQYEFPHLDKQKYVKKQ